MQKTNSFQARKLTGITGILTIFLICWMTQIAFGADRSELQIGFTEQGKIALNIHMASVPVCSLLTLDLHTYRLKISGSDESRLKKTASPLWEFFPVEILRETNTDHSFLMDFRIPGSNGDGATLHSKTAGITLLFGGELVQNTWKKAMAYGSRKYNTLEVAVQEQLTAALDSMPASPRDPVLPRIMQQARRNRQYTWYNKVYSKVYQRQPAQLKDLRALAQYFEQTGDTGTAGIEWYEYYQRKAASGLAVYTDHLPAGSHVVQEELHSGIVGRPARDQGWAWWWIAIIPLITAMGAGSRWLYRRVNRAGNPAIETEGESLNALEFESFLEEINQKFHTESSAEPDAKVVPEPASESEGVAGKGAEEETRADRIRKRLKNYPERQRMQDILPKQSRVYKLSQMDMAPELIAKKLNISRGEVELLLKIGNKNEHDSGATLRKERMVSDQYAHESVRELSRHMHISEQEAKLLRLKRWGN